MSSRIQHDHVDNNNAENSKLDEILLECRNQKRVIAELQNEVRISATKKTKIDSWKFKGNRMQYDFNEGLSKDMEQIAWAISSQKLHYTRKLLDDAKETLRKRNKLIRIADTSEGGWNTVDEYQVHPLASDSEDESKLIKAENRALRKKKSKSQSGSSNKTHKSFNKVFFCLCPALLKV